MKSLDHSNSSSNTALGQRNNRKNHNGSLDQRPDLAAEHLSGSLVAVAELVEVGWSLKKVRYIGIKQ